MTAYEFGLAAMAFGALMLLMGFFIGYFHPFGRARQPRDEAWQWIAEHYPKALREMPTALFRDLRSRGSGR